MAANNEEIIFPLTQLELQAISDLLHKRTTIRFDPDAPWTGENMIEFRTRVDAELALLKARKPI